MASVWGELKRRNVVKVAVAYAVVGWLLVQIADVFVPALQLPEWTVTFVAGLVILGFPLALVLSWAYELTPEGMKRSRDVAATATIVYSTGRKLDFAIIGALFLALGFVAVDNYLLGSSEEEAGVLPNSVAVLLCDNLSPDPDDAYFAASIHEEILNQLVKIRDLNVIARTSVLQYAESPPPIPQIAEELNVETVMECSVRYAGDAIVVTAQLINPVTNSHLWSETYPGDLSDLSTVFAMQADIAMNIANALEAEFSLAEQESIEKIPTANPTAYVLYLQVLSAPTGVAALALLDQAIQLDSDFALAYARRASMNTGRIIGVVANTAPDEALVLEQSVRADAQHALSIDPTLGLAHAALAVVHQANWRAAQADEAFRRARDLSPNDVRVLWQYGEFKRIRGDYDEAILLTQRAVELDPNDMIARMELGITYRTAGNWDAAAAVFQGVESREPAYRPLNVNAALGSVEASRGNVSEAVRRLQLAERLGPLPAFRLARMAHDYALAGRSDDAARIFAEFEEQATQAGIGDGWWAFAYIAGHDYERALQYIESAVNRRVNADQLALTELAANPWGDPELDKPEFRELFDRLWLE